MAPAQAQSQGSPEPGAIRDFNKFLKKIELLSVIYEKKPKPFVCITEVRTHLREHNCQRLENLLDTLYQGDPNTPDYEEVLKKYTAILCILMKIRKGCHIQHFVESADLDDGHLPFNTARMPDNFPDDTEDQCFYDRFCETQWMFLAVSFTENMSKSFGDPSPRILPVTLNKELRSGGSGTVSKIEIHGCYNLLRGEQPNVHSTSVSPHYSHRWAKISIPW
jgi:hypothetical protein